MTMTRGEASDLMSVVRMRAKVAKAAVDALAADRKADVERELSTIHKRDDALWAEIVAGATAATQIADEQIAVICRREGIREEFRPSIHVSWYGRGENALKERRAELHVAAFKAVEAHQKAAHQQVDRWRPIAAPPSCLVNSPPPTRSPFRVTAVGRRAIAACRPAR